MILRKCYGGAYLAMCGKDLGADRVFAWPTAEVAVMGAEGAAEIVFRKEIQEAEDKAAKRKELIERYREAFSNPYVAAGRRLVDAVIEPSLTRRARGPGARVPAHQARTASAQEARTDAAVEKENTMTKRFTARNSPPTLETAPGANGGNGQAHRVAWQRNAGRAAAAAAAARCRRPLPRRAKPRRWPPAGRITEEELLAISAAHGGVPRSARPHPADPADQLSRMGPAGPRVDSGLSPAAQLGSAVKLNITIDRKTYEVDVEAAEPEAPATPHAAGRRGIGSAPVRVPAGAAAGDAARGRQAP